MKELNNMGNLRKELCAICSSFCKLKIALKSLEPSMVSHACTLTTWKAETEEKGFKSSLDYTVRTCLKVKNLLKREASLMRDEIYTCLWVEG